MVQESEVALDSRPMTAEHLSECLSCIIHTILLHRSFAPCDPVTATVPNLDTKYSYAMVAANFDLVRREVAEFVYSLNQRQHSSGGSERGSMVVNVNDSSGVCWESWKLPVVLSSRHAHNGAPSAQWLAERVELVMHLANIPTATFPDPDHSGAYPITIQKEYDSNEQPGIFGGLFQRLVPRS